jgi:hypothetical protein
MSVIGISEPMLQYGMATEEIIKRNRPKHPKAYGVKQPEMRNIVTVLVGIIFVLVVIKAFM